MNNNVLGVTQDSMALMKSAVMAPFEGRFVQGSWNPLQKAAISTQSGIYGYDLMAPAKLLIPFITPLRNELPRRNRGGNPGLGPNWKQINAIGDQGYASMGWTNEGSRAGQLNFSATPKSATYQTIGAEDAITFEEESASQGYDDANALATFLLLEQMMVKEEIALLGGNNSLKLGIPGTPVLTHSGTGSSLTNTAYNVYVVALTLEGYQNSSITSGVATQKTIVSADGKQSTINGGSSTKSSVATVTPSAGENIFATTTIKNGAVAYAWYWGASGSELLGAITTINSVKISATATGTQNASGITQDLSVNDGTTGGGANQVTAFDGLMTNTFSNSASSNAYVASLVTGTPGIGTVLTASGKGTVNEIDALLLYLWNTWRISPNKMWVNAQQLKDITTLCLNASSGPLLRINSDGNGDIQLTAGATVSFYMNYFTTNGGTKIPVAIHPNMPAGTIYFQCTQLPTYYKSNETPTVAEVITRRDYYRIDWPLVTRERQYGVYSEECLAVYAPFGFAILNNIAAL